MHALLSIHKESRPDLPQGVEDGENFVTIAHLSLPHTATNERTPIPHGRPPRAVAVPLPFTVQYCTAFTFLACVLYRVVFDPGLENNDTGR